VAAAIQFAGYDAAPEFREFGVSLGAAVVSRMAAVLRRRANMTPMANPTLTRRLVVAGVSLLSAALLAACGGGDHNGGGHNSGDEGPSRR
jgi:hypothetical protein